MPTSTIRIMSRPTMTPMPERQPQGCRSGIGVIEHRDRDYRIAIK